MEKLCVVDKGELMHKHTALQLFHAAGYLES